MANSDSSPESHYHPPTDDYYGQTVIHPFKNIERQDEKESDSVQIKLKSHLLMEFRLLKVSEIVLGPSQLFYDCVSAFKDWHTSHIQRKQGKS